MDVIEAIHKRTSVRNFSGRQVEKEKLMRLLRAGQQAPSVRNGQPWMYVVIRKKDTLEKLAQIKKSWNPLRQAPVGICIFIDKNRYSSKHLEYFAQDCGAASENILLAAVQEGLGGVWLGTYPDRDACGKVKILLGLPDRMIPFNLIALGYPSESDGVKPARKELAVFYEKYDKAE